MTKLGICTWLVISCAALESSAQTQFVNWETPPVHPVEMTADGTKLLVANTADDRIEVFSLGGPLPVWVTSIPVGLEPVSVRARNNGEVWVANHLSDSVSILNLATMNVAATVSVGDEPTDVIFAGNPQRAFVCVSRENQVKVYDPSDLSLAPTELPIQGKDPRALATDGMRVYVTIFHSGNRSTILPAPAVSDPAGPWGGMNPPPNNGPAFNPPIAAGLPPPPPVSLIVNKEMGHWKDDNQGIWDALVTWNVNEHEIGIIDVATLAVTYASNLVNNINMAVAVQPGTGRVTFTGHHLRNEARFETTVRSQFTRVNICNFDPLNPPTPESNNGAGVSDVNQHLFVNPPSGEYITSATPAQRALSLSDPRGMAWNAAGSAAYISGMGSNNIIKTDNMGQRMGTIAVGAGPTGLAMDGPRNRLYCLNRFDGTVSVINTINDTEVGRVPFFDPTPPVIKTGRPFLYDAHLTSRLGQSSCASCHVDARTDAQAWDLGDPSGVTKSFDQTCDEGTPFVGPCVDWHPMKGPLMTQSLIGSAGGGPLHWRGDREDMHAFSVGFTGLLGAANAPTAAEIDALEAYLATIRFAPNPFRTFDDQLPASVPGFSGNPGQGETIFHTVPLMTPPNYIDWPVARCVECHSQPGGGLNTVISGPFLAEPQDFNVPGLRELYRKTAFSFTSTSNNLGFGFTHDGSADTIFDYLQRPQFLFPANAAGDAQRRDLEAYVMCFSTDTHPAIGTQVTVTGYNNDDPAIVALVNKMVAVADTGAVSIVAKGRVGGMARGYAYLQGAGNFPSDRFAEVISATGLRQSALLGSEITFTVVPSDTQARIGIDRDADGHFDRDELDAGSNPNDALSTPARAGLGADPTGVDKARYLSLTVTGAPGATSAIRVTLVQLMVPDPPNLAQFPAPDFTAHAGGVRWLGPVGDCVESESPPMTFKCALLQCTPHYTDWAADLGGQVLHITGVEVLPSSNYDILEVAQSCAGVESNCRDISAPLHLRTLRWGDIVAPFQAPSPEPLTQPNIADISACVDKFRGLASAPIVARADVNPSPPNHQVQIPDIASVVDGFKGFAYPYLGFGTCP